VPLLDLGFVTVKGMHITIAACPWHGHMSPEHINTDLNILEFYLGHFPWVTTSTSVTRCSEP
jgi:hypothetical protein